MVNQSVPGGGRGRRLDGVTAQSNEKSRLIRGESRVQHCLGGPLDVVSGRGTRRSRLELVCGVRKWRHSIGGSICAKSQKLSSGRLWRSVLLLDVGTQEGKRRGAEPVRPRLRFLAAARLRTSTKITREQPTSPSYL